jgi:hypothetical protein
MGRSLQGMPRRRLRRSREVRPSESACYYEPRQMPVRRGVVYVRTG